MTKTLVTDKVEHAGQLIEIRVPTGMAATVTWRNTLALNPKKAPTLFAGAKVPDIRVREQGPRSSTTQKRQPAPKPSEAGKVKKTPGKTKSKLF